MPNPPLLYLVIVLSGLLGLSLGAFGGGGTLLAVPMLIYIAKMDAQRAIGMSLLIVSLISALASFMYWKAKLVDVRAVAWLGPSGAVAALVGARFTSLLSDRSLSLLFASLMLFVSTWMLFRKDTPHQTSDVIRDHSPLLLLSIGSSIGFLTGFLGVGGGFLIVPALTLVAELPIQRAVGTSLAIITINSMLGFIGHIDNLDVTPWAIAVLVIPAVLGAWTGQQLAQRWPAKQTRTGFALLSLTVAIGMFAIELT